MELTQNHRALKGGREGALFLYMTHVFGRQVLDLAIGGVDPRTNSFWEILAALFCTFGHNLDGAV